MRSGTSEISDEQSTGEVYQLYDGVVLVKFRQVKRYLRSSVAGLTYAIGYPNAIIRSTCEP